MPKGKSYSFRNPPASAIDKKFTQKNLHGMKKAPNSPTTSKMKSSAKKKY